MNGLLASITSGVAAFVATNIDDLVILTVFFAQVNSRFRRRHIVAGQYFGFVALVLVSLPGFFGGQVIPKPLIGLLGLVPIALGLLQWFKREPEAEEADAVAVNAPSGTIAASPRTASAAAKWSDWLQRGLAHAFSPQTHAVATVTFANGGDNIGIYVPLFASTNLASLLVTLATFLVLVGVWCGIAAALTYHPLITKLLRRNSAVLVPLVLIGLGIYIFLENGTLGLLTDTAVFAP